MTTSIEKLPTGIEGFDHISKGGLPRGRTTLVAGTAGSGKTVFAAQFVAEGVRRGEAGVFDFAALVVRIESAVKRVGAARLSLDSLGAVFSQFEDMVMVRSELHRLAAALRLRYVELFGEMRRGITVLKMRGSSHEKNIREFIIEMGGMRIGRPFRNVVGILSGNPQQLSMAPEELERIRDLFRD